MKIAVKEKISTKGGRFRPAILSLRQALGKTQEDMASLVGCSFAAYRKWESGAANPGGQWLIRLLALCPDAETRRAFDLESGTSNLESPRPHDPAPDHADRLRQYSDAVTGLTLIYEAAESGHTAADELLRDLADKLTARGGDWRRMKYFKAR
jgi:transcriptional regulator with XRE-family HTH domain